MRYSPTYPADRTQVNNKSYLHLKNYFGLQFGAEGTQTTATNAKPFNVGSNSNEPSNILRSTLYIGLFIVVLTGCFPFADHETSARHLTGPFYLSWSIEPKEQVIMESSDNSGLSGTIVVKPTVFAVGYNDSFLIVKHHPDKEEEIRFRLFKGTNHRGDYLMEDPNDSVYLSRQDSIYQEDGKWFHISNGWSPSDTLKPYRAETLYSIIDIRNYDLQTWHGRDKVYTFKSPAEFHKKREELGVPRNLDFTIIDTTLQ